MELITFAYHIVAKPTVNYTRCAYYYSASHQVVYIIGIENAVNGFNMMVMAAIPIKAPSIKTEKYSTLPCHRDGFRRVVARISKC